MQMRLNFNMNFQVMLSKYSGRFSKYRTLKLNKIHKRLKYDFEYESATASSDKAQSGSAG